LKNTQNFLVSYFSLPYDVIILYGPQLRLHQLYMEYISYFGEIVIFDCFKVDSVIPFVTSYLKDFPYWYMSTVQSHLLWRSMWI